METTTEHSEKVDIQEFLKDYPEFKMQYLFFNCFIIYSDSINSLYEAAKSKHNKKFNKIEIYYTPNYLYEINKNNPIFDKINKQIKKGYYFLKEHIFYYQYLLRLVKRKEKNEVTDTTNINEITYRTLMNRLYLLYDYPNLKNINYGKSEIFGVPCIYSIIESNILEQIINMKKFSCELMKMSEDKVNELFGINDDIEAQSFMFNKLLLSISEGNSTVQKDKEISYDLNDDLNKINKGAIELEKFLINLSSELFLSITLQSSLIKMN